MITVKRGDTLAFIVRRTNEDGTPRTGESLNLKAQMRTSKEVLIAEFVIKETEVPGNYLFSISAIETALWTPGTYICDIEFTKDGVVESSDTFNIMVTKDVTRP